MLNINQLRWRCRRGTQELDLLLLTYLEQQFSASSTELQQSFNELLFLEDNCLQDYLFGNTVPERKDFQILVGMIQAGTRVNF